MGKLGVQNYAGWQHTLFWLSWVSLLIPVYFIGRGVALVSSLLLSGYSDMLDWALFAIFGTALLEVLLIGVYTLTHFWRHQGYPFRRLLLWLTVGILIIPLAAVLGAIYAYVQLAV